MTASSRHVRCRRITPRDLLAVAVALAAVTVTPGIVRAEDRVARWFGHEQGLTGVPVAVLAQDSTGFLWIGAEGGLFRVSESEPWTDASGGPAFRWVGLSPGRYRAEFRASLDGHNWSEPAPLAFTVRPPWYRERRAAVVFVLLGVTFLLAACRARVVFLLGLERQRTQLAMDLHDEVGSGLASITILSELAVDGAEDDVERKTLVGEIATTSQDLSSSLSDLVWSLDRRPSTLKDLADRLADHGTRLFSNGCTRFNVRLPESWPPTAVAFQVRRAVLLIGLEALHNAARHSRAQAVTLSLERDDADWLLKIEDDGVGLPACVFDRCDDSRGLGLKSIRERARRIAADIEWRSAPDQGTAILLRFGLRRRRGLGVRLPSLPHRVRRSLDRTSHDRAIGRSAVPRLTSTNATYNRCRRGHPRSHRGG